MLKNHLKKLNNYRIRIFTKIKSICPYDTPNLSTKFHPNPSTTFWDIVLYIVFGPISQWWRITLKIQVVGSGYRSSTKSNQFVLVTHPTFTPNVIRIRQQLFEISCTQTNRQKGVENTISFTFGGRGKYNFLFTRPDKCETLHFTGIFYVKNLSNEHTSFLVTDASSGWRYCTQ